MPAEEVMPVIQSNLDYMEEDKPLIPGVTVRAATADKLVHICIESFCKYRTLSI
jgi:hypothetical protein